MSLVIILSLLVLFAGLVLYFVCAGRTKSSIAEIGKIMFFCGLLSFLIGNGSQGCSLSAGSGGSAQHK
jgi:hypothetical protein